MKIIHRVSLTPNESQRRVLLSLGLPLIESNSPLVQLVSFDVEECEESWPRVKELIEQWKLADFVRTEFSKGELDSASFHQIFAWQQGYPQPEGDFGYLNATYDLTTYCPMCGIGNTQIAPFRMKDEPKWGKKHILQLNWVFDEYFVLPAVWKEVFQPLGIGCSPVLNHRTGNELTTVVQLDIKTTANSALSMNDKYPSEICGSCHRKKYLPISRGFFPAFTTDPSTQMCRTQEYFGSGASAWNAVIANNALYKTIQSNKLVGVTFVPLHA